ncbi:Ig-like domain-containing protein, partial [Acinetobacter puyangensis]|uniref:Ig-like domain-containing protein n=1 Tax=Acinetobacter puyangensis TaxID=1096779 RepID=UPI003A4E0E28
LSAGEEISLTFTFSEAVTGFDASDIAVTGGVLSNLTQLDDSTWTATFTQSGTEAPSVTVADDSYTDLAGNPGTGAVLDATNGGFTSDTVAPTLEISASDLELSAGEEISLTFTFSEAVTGFDASDIAVTGGVLSNLTQLDDSTWTATFTQSGTEAPSVTVADDSYTDLAGNPGTGAVLDATNGGFTFQVDAQNDEITFDFGQQLQEDWDAAIVDNDVTVIDLLAGFDSSTEGVDFSVPNDSTNESTGRIGDVVITVTQDNLVALAPGFSVTIVQVNNDGSLTEIYTATEENGGLIADVAGLALLGIVNDGNSIAVQFKGLEEGNYRVIVQNDTSVLEDLLTDITISDLGGEDTILGSTNQAAIFSAIETVLPGSLGTTLVAAVNTLLIPVNTLGAPLSSVLNSILAILPTEVLDQIVDDVVAPIVANTLSIYQVTEVTVNGKESYFDFDAIQGNVFADNGNGADSIDAATVITQVKSSNETDYDAITGSDPVNIQGEYGVLTIYADGTYSYIATADINTIGQIDTFDYTISNGLTNDTAQIIINITGKLFNDIQITSITEDSGIDGDFITNDSTLLISGTLSNATELSEGSRVEIQIDSGDWTEVTLDAVNGTWSYDNTSNVLSEGTHTVIVRVVDSQGTLISSSSREIIGVDTIAPTQYVEITSYTDNIADYEGDFLSNTVTNDLLPLLNGTISDSLGSDEVIEVYSGTTLLGTAIVDAANNTWSYQVTSNLSEGANIFTAKVVDLAGNSGSESNEFIINIDVTLPTQLVEIVSYTDDVGVLQDDFASGTFTDDTLPVLNGTFSATLAADEVIRVYLGTTLLGIATVDSVNNTWSYALTAAQALAEGAYSFTAMVADAAGNQGTISNEFVINVDLTAPEAIVSIDSFSDDVGAIQGDAFTSGTTTDDRTPVLNGTISGELADDEQVAIYTSDNEFVGYATVNAGTWTYELDGLLDDTTYTYYATVQDAAGNQGNQSSDFTISIDLTVVVNSQSTLDTTPIISGSTGFLILEGEYLEVTVNGKTYSSQTGAVVIDFDNNTWYVQIPDSDALTVGSYNVSAVLKNVAGTITQDDTTNELVVSPSPIVTVGAGGGDPNQKATAVTLTKDGTWLIHSNQTQLTSTATSSSTLGDFSKTALVSNTGTGYDANNYVQNATFVDYNRDGLMDLFAIDSNYNDGQQMFYNNNGTWVAYQVGANTNTSQTGDFAGDAGTDGSANTWSWYGGIIAIDKNGDGYVDLVNGDQTPNDSAIRGGYGSQIVLNNDGTITGMSKDGTFATDYAANSIHQPIGLDQSQPDMELSGVDINNDGIVDFVMHSQNIVADGSRINKDSATNSTAAISTNQARLVVVNGTDSGTWNVTQVVENVFQRGTDDDPNIGNGVAMTWADFNGDGYLDLFLGRGSESDTAASGAANNAGEYASRIYFNDGTGKLVFSDPNNDGIGNPTAAGKYTFTDNVAGGASIALDWNGDGKMDIIELPGTYRAGAGGVSAAGAVGPINLYTNTTSGTTVGFTTSNLLTQVGLTTIGSTSNSVTGAIAIDIDWDGDRDLLAFTLNGTTTYIENKNNVADGTVLHARILDKNGINIFYGNTVQLIDEATGLVVSTQIINPQSGNQTNDSTGIVDFYGLDASKTYSIKLLSGATGYTWTGLKTGAANDAYVFTAEAENAVNNASDQGGATNKTGIVGTGYNDTLYATQGTDLYNGAGGTTTISGVKSWSNTGGLDIVDYKNAGSASLTIDLSNTGYQATGFGTAKFVNIEGIAGADGNDTFTNDASNNQFEGRGGNDTFNLIHGGNDTLLYKVLDAANATGGNGSDVVNGFHVGTWEATPNADRIDLSELLIGYTGSVTPASYINGTPTLVADAEIRNYLSVQSDGTNTTISIDRDGAGGAYSSTTLVTLNDVDTTLEKLLANHQIIIG